MKKVVVIVLFLGLIFTGCKKSESTENKEVEIKKATVELLSIGEEITKDNALTSSEMLAKFNNLKAGDTINVKFASTINDLCSKKGCWMKLPLDNDKETMVRFKDYGFFMPLDAKDKNVIVEGKAFVKETSVDELKHYAEDAGKSKEEIAKITEPKVEFAFEAHGVLLNK